MTAIHHESIADKVFTLIEEAILSGRYEKGHSLTELALSAEYGVSRTPIREAVRRLEQEHLIRESGKGIVVIGISADDVADIYEVRGRLEPLAAALAARRTDEKSLTALGEILDKQEYYTLHENSEQVRNADSEFHTAIYEACGNETLTEILALLHKKIQLYRKTSLGDPKRAERALSEHREIYAALKNKNEKELERLVSLHLENARKRLLKINEN